MTIWAFNNRLKGSVMLKHVMGEHREKQDQVDFGMNIVGRFKDCVSRELKESIRLRNKPQYLLLTSKSKFYSPLTKRKVYK